MEMDECASAPCLNNGTCVDGIAEYSCLCGAGWEGKAITRTFYKKKFRLSVFMHNIAIFLQMIISIAGKRCEVEKGGCEREPCQNDGKCVNLVGDYFCVFVNFSLF